MNAKVGIESTIRESSRMTIKVIDGGPGVSFMLSESDEHGNSDLELARHIKPCSATSGRPSTDRCETRKCYSVPLLCDSTAVAVLAHLVLY